MAAVLIVIIMLVCFSGEDGTRVASGPAPTASGPDTKLSEPAGPKSPTQEAEPEPVKPGQASKIRIPVDWTKETRPVKTAAPDGESVREITYYKNSIGMEFLLVPAGGFMMGSENGDKDEKPVHRVRITEPFYMGVFEVTQAQYQQVMHKNPSRFRDRKKPVETVSWNHAVEFCSRLSSADGVTYRLPTEAEWEHACRAGSTGEYCFGDDATKLVWHAWYAVNSRSQSRLVGQKKPNAWGLHDMHGNVWEWCADRYAEDYYARSPWKEPQGPSTGERRVLRGGSWNDSADLTRSAKRLNLSPKDRYPSIGFRVVVSAQE